ncbi:MAG: transglycosylase SLT domain-containing protein [Ignavibacteriae bacterium]|nr:transglycosylase SLT domain-containing protein [Ignavibacteriota bacterium]
MKGLPYIISMLGLSIVVGCTPVNQNTIRKDEVGKETMEPHQISSPSFSEVMNLDLLLDTSTRSIILSYGPTIKKYAEKYGFDWRLVLAIMRQESGFEIEAESHKGASGLMQIMPATSKEVAKVLEIDDMTHPKNNIRGGIFYLKRLYNLFEGAEEIDRIRLSLAAYNAGVGRIYDAQELAAYLSENPTKWQAVRDALPLLSKRYYTLHRNVWPQEKPRAGFFGNSRETIQYVERIMGFYDEYRLALN